MRPDETRLSLGSATTRAEVPVMVEPATPRQEMPAMDAADTNIREIKVFIGRQRWATTAEQASNAFPCGRPSPASVARILPLIQASIKERPMYGIRRFMLVMAAMAATACGDRTSENEAGVDTAAVSAANVAATPQLTDANIVALLNNSHQAEMSLAATARTSAA